MAFRNLRFELVRAPRQWAAGRHPPGGDNVYNYMAFLHFTYPYPDIDYMNDYAWLHLVMSLFCHGADGLPHCGDTACAP